MDGYEAAWPRRTELHLGSKGHVACPHPGAKLGVVSVPGFWLLRRVRATRSEVTVLVQSPLVIQSGGT